jgi:hypothetical protein
MYTVDFILGTFIRGLETFLAIFILRQKEDRIGGVMVSIVASSAVDRGFWWCNG